jgi:hypothetical protein
MNPVCKLPCCSLKIHFNNILPAMPRPSRWPLAFRLFYLNMSVSHMGFMPCPSHPWFDHFSHFGKELMSVLLCYARRRT